MCEQSDMIVKGTKNVVATSKARRASMKDGSFLQGNERDFNLIVNAMKGMLTRKHKKVMCAP